jgi:hypothetical protein
MRELAAILARIDISIAQSRIPDPAGRAFLLFQMLIRSSYYQRRMPETEVPFTADLGESMNCAIFLF